MQALIRYVGLGLAALVGTGCSHETSMVYGKPSPNGATRIQLITFSRLPLAPRMVAELELLSGSGRTVLRKWESSEMYPCFVTAAWTQDSAAVIVLFRDCWHGSDVLAFDMR